MTKKVFIAVLFFSLVVIGSYCYLWVKIVQKNQNVGTLLGEVAALNAEKDLSSYVKERIVETTSMREKLAGYFIPKDGVVPFLNKIQALGAENNLEFKVDSVAIEDEVSAPDSFENVKLNIEVEGTWADLYRFTTLTELMPLRVFADRVNLEMVPLEVSGTFGKKKLSETNPLWQGKISLRVLKLK